MSIKTGIQSSPLLFWSDTMTNKELIETLLKYPDDCIVMYRHNKYSCIDIDFVDFREETLLSEEKIHTIILEASFEED